MSRACCTGDRWRCPARKRRSERSSRAGRETCNEVCARRNTRGRRRLSDPAPTRPPPLCRTERGARDRREPVHRARAGPLRADPARVLSSSRSRRGRRDAAFVLRSYGDLRRGAQALDQLRARSIDAPKRMQHASPRHAPRAASEVRRRVVFRRVYAVEIGRQHHAAVHPVLLIALRRHTWSMAISAARRELCPQSGALGVLSERSLAASSGRSIG